MNQSIELHDSELSAISCTDNAVVLILTPAYVHRSGGHPGRDRGTGWSQTASLSIFDAEIASTYHLPASICEGVLRIGGDLYENMIPAEGTFEALIDFRIILSTGQSLAINGRRLVIALHGSPLYVEDFKG